MGDRRISFSNADAGAEREKREQALIATGKYDRKSLRARLEIEQWIDTEVKGLFQIKDDDDHPVEIDVDEVAEADDDDARAEMLKNLLAGAKNASDVPFFIKTLLKKMREANLIKE